MCPRRLVCFALGLTALVTFISGSALKIHSAGHFQQLQTDSVWLP